VPEELFHAAGFTPVFIFHTADDRARARAHLPGFICWVAGSALDGAGVPHLLVELERTAQVGQLHTRVEAFVEMVNRWSG
jgi:benzoyl-CoA reductase/2-hydroxyglutaryl-CoA dehydratase subunit BcrC/BadD/HgdB